jgi:23S rRNA U2552 (ribose-2'-O)-methylase RlmE/FtsJ
MEWKEFKLHFRELLTQYNIRQRSPTTVKNPQSNAIIERIHAVIKDMISTSGLDNQDEITEDDIADVLCNIAYGLFDHHTIQYCKLLLVLLYSDGICYLTFLT